LVGLSFYREQPARYKLALVGTLMLNSGLPSDLSDSLQRKLIMPQGFAELLMYVAPAQVCVAQQAWLSRVLQRLGASRLDAQGLDLKPVWLSPQLLLTQTCGYPLMTALRGQVQVVGRPVYQLPHSADGEHCSLLLARIDDPRSTLAEFRGSLGLLNADDSNSGMNLFRHALAPLQQDGRFFSGVLVTGGHRNSLLALQTGQGDLAAIDSVTFDYLARDHSPEVAGLKIVARSAPSPCLPYITALHQDAEAIRTAMNQALRDMPEVAQVLAISEVLEASPEDYQLLLDYERQAVEWGLPSLC
jgi:ABC-type phosphate/phosphonate transport system substrate-binding protein